ncbi:MAG TPA: ATP-binding protein [Planctomycetota bacterium]|nr:ATP-binding protein [Planctomycetota bacterium]
MKPTPVGSRILHLGSDPSDSALLAAELESEGIACRVLSAAAESEFDSALRSGPVALVVADLPLPWENAAARLAELQRKQPELRVIFRTGSPGNRTIAESTPQTARAVREALAQPGIGTSAQERAVIDRVVQDQSAYLRLARRDMWDFEDTLRDITRTAAELLDVARVSMWEVERESSKLRCVLVYEREKDLHACTQELELGPRYLAALESAMFVAADHAQDDPRTSEFTRAYLAELGITSLLDAPVRREGRIVGVLCNEHVGPERHWSLLDQCSAVALAGIVARALEVRDRRRAEARLRAAEKFEVIGRLAGRLAHDFNNQLTVILGNAELALERPGVEAAERESLQQILQAGEDASALIRQLLAYSRREAVHPRVVDLREQILGHLPMVRRLLGADVQVRAALGSVPRWVEIDPTQFQQVLLNLAANARDAMPRGGEFELALSREKECGPGSRVRLQARDTGEGMSAEVLPQIFEPFFTTKEAKLGTGLGLASVSEIVRRAGGEIRVASTPGQGSSFELLLPEAPMPRSERHAATGAEAKAELQAGHGTALVVESDPKLRRAFTEMLAHSGTRVLEASGPVEALEVLARGENFDWVLTDHALPKMDGARLIRHLRDFRPKLPALLLADSGRLDAAELELLRRSGKTVVLSKPLTPEELLAALEQL